MFNKPASKATAKQELLLNKPEACLLNGSWCLAPALGVTKITNV
jgi:hypothetical protein